MRVVGLGELDSADLNVVDVPINGFGGPVDGVVVEYALVVFGGECETLGVVAAGLGIPVGLDLASSTSEELPVTVIVSECIFRIMSKTYISSRTSDNITIEETIPTPGAAFM